MIGRMERRGMGALRDRDAASGLVQPAGAWQALNL
jgi:hypothetical protein